jgi:ElaB/YqjD/DUF883 family membrane-anchored ribosome-binding protein
MVQTGNVSGFKQDATRLGDDVHTLKADLGIVATDAMAAARSGARSGAHELHESARQVVDTAKEQLASAQDTAREAKDSFAGVVRRHPLASIGIAAGVGLLISMVVFRPRS